MAADPTFTPKTRCSPPTAAMGEAGPPGQRSSKNENRLWKGCRALRRRAQTLMRLWGNREFERQYLTTLDDGQLRGIGLTREAMRCEASKPFWRS